MHVALMRLTADLYVAEGDTEPQGRGLPLTPVGSILRPVRKFRKEFIS
jgi:hypothetical protein